VVKFQHPRLFGIEARRPARIGQRLHPGKKPCIHQDSAVMRRQHWRDLTLDRLKFVVGM
jgi:hypothetical protein